jgi:hypothetical protein
MFVKRILSYVSAFIFSELTRDMRLERDVGLPVKCLLFRFIFNQNCNMSTDLVKFNDGHFVCTGDTTCGEGEEKETDRNAERHGGDNSSMLSFKFSLRLLQNMGKS